MAQLWMRAAALINAFEAATQGYRQLTEEAEYLCALMKTHVELALDSGTPTSLIASFLSEVRSVVLSPRKGTS